MSSKYKQEFHLFLDDRGTNHYDCGKYLLFFLHSPFYVLRKNQETNVVPIHLGPLPNNDGSTVIRSIGDKSLQRALAKN
jgi:hypothetical protein